MSGELTEKLEEILPRRRRACGARARACEGPAGCRADARPSGRIRPRAIEATFAPAAERRNPHLGLRGAGNDRSARNVTEPVPTPVKDSFAMRRRHAWANGLVSLLSAAVVVSTGCFSFPAMPLPGIAATEAAPPGVLGSFTVSSPLLGNVTVAPTACSGGDLQQFLGGDFSDPASGVVVRLVVDPLEGPAARAFDAADPFRKSVVLRRSDCAVFHFSLEHTGLTINEVRDYRLSLELDCALADGTTVHGNASTTHCH